MLKGLLLTLLVLAGPMQAQAAHFCNVMEQAVENCCCSHDEQRVQQRPADCLPSVAEPCCRTVVSLVVDEAAAVPPAGKVGVSAHDPPPLAPPLSTSPPTTMARAAVPYGRLCPDLSKRGTRTYLHTLRLRL